jgi:cyclic di-GMP phosphodiesterase Gmr
MRVAAEFDVAGDEPLSGEDLAALVHEAGADGRFYAKVLADSMTWACANLHVGSILVAPVTAKALMDDEFISQLLRSQADARVGRIKLWLEVPASNLTTVPAGLSERMEFLTLQGLKLMVGEFGNDHANLASLATLPLHALALDEDFVSTVGLYLRSGVLAANVASMAWDLDYTVVAGGIKFADQREELAEAACKYAWGPLFGRPQQLTCPTRSVL